MCIYYTFIAVKTLQLRITFQLFLLFYCTTKRLRMVQQFHELLKYTALIFKGKKIIFKNSSNPWNFTAAENCYQLSARNTPVFSINWFYLYLFKVIQLVCTTHQLVNFKSHSFLKRQSTASKCLSFTLENECQPNNASII